MNTKIINFIGGPSAGKTTLSALLFSEMKMRGYNVEYVQEYAKNLVWMEDYETLNNQYLVSKTQADLFEKIDGKVEYIITDACLLHGIYYNRYNPENVSNIEKTEKYIWKKYNQFRNINILVKRMDYEYEKVGRTQSEEEAKEIDEYFSRMLKEREIAHREYRSDRQSIGEMIKYIKELSQHAS